LLLVPITIGGREAQFVLDTGSVATVVDTTLAEHLAPLKRSEQPHVDGLPEMYELPDTYLTGSKLKIVGETACLDLSENRIATGHDIGGILGMSFLKDYVLQIDFDRGHVRFLKSVSELKQTAMKMSHDRFGRPVLTVKLATDRSVPMVVDTGMAVTGIGEVNRTIFRELLAENKVTVKGPPGRASSVSGNLVGRNGRLSSIRLGNFEHQQLGIREGSMNALGLLYLSRYQLTLDFPHDTIYLEKGDRFPEPTPFDMSGMAIVRIEGVTTVNKVHPDGPAFALGIQAGDQITYVGDKQASDFSLLQLRRLLTQDKQHVALVIRRGTEVREYDLVLRDWQPLLTKTDRGNP
jgi:hypothetical protein